MTPWREEHLSFVLTAVTDVGMRRLTRTQRPEKRPSRTKLHNLVDCIIQNLDGTWTLGQMAAIADLSSYHFAQQFKAGYWFLTL
jgi:AraC-like DNA-binding protein